MRRVRLGVRTVVGAILGATLSALILLSVGLEVPPNMAGFGEIASALLMLFAALYMGFFPARVLHENGIPTSLERYAGLWFGCELAFAGLAGFLFVFHRVWTGVAIAAFYELAVVVFFVDVYRKPLLPEGRRLVVLKTTDRDASN